MLVCLFLAASLTLGLSSHIHEMGRIPVHHRVVVMIKEPGGFGKHFMGKCGFVAEYVGTGEGETVHREAGKKKWPAAVRTQRQPPGRSDAQSGET